MLELTVLLFPDDTKIPLIEFTEISVPFVLVVIVLLVIVLSLLSTEIPYLSVVVIVLLYMVVPIFEAALVRHIPSLCMSVILLLKDYD